MIDELKSSIKEGKAIYLLVLVFRLLWDSQIGPN